MKYRVRNFFIIAALIFVGYLLQYSVFIFIPYVNSSPNILLIITFTFAYIRNKNAGMLVGFFAGLSMDIFYCQVLGYNAIVFVLVGLVCGSLKKVYYSTSLLSQMLILMASDISCSLIYYFVWYIMQSKFAFGYCFVYIFLPEFCFTLLMGLIIVRPLSLLVKKMYVNYEAEAE